MNAVKQLTANPTLRVQSVIFQMQIKPLRGFCSVTNNYMIPEVSLLYLGSYASS
ncbi:MAG TPA: hypothetical protein V6D14_19865 [Coleofasciculaceae cyanobacterium]|jgi:hypothetical protein